MELHWAPEFEIGNEYVDLQHRYFLDLITRIGKRFIHLLIFPTYQNVRTYFQT